MSQTIYRMASKSDPFARIPHTMLDDVRLSWRAKGVLAYLCGKPGGWKMRVSDVSNHGTDGKHAIRSALNELRGYGYAELSQIRVAGKIKEWVWKISDSPIFPPDTKFQDVVIQDLENQHSSKKEPTKNDQSKKESKETKETCSLEHAGISDFSNDRTTVKWKPDSRSKEDQLQTLSMPTSFPSETQFDAFIDEYDLYNLASGMRGDLYSTLSDQKWHHWNGRKWQLIRDWRLYIKALEDKITDATAF